MFNGGYVCLFFWWLCTFVCLLRVSVGIAIRTIWVVFCFRCCLVWSGFAFGLWCLGFLGLVVCLASCVAGFWRVFECMHLFSLVFLSMGLFAFLVFFLSTFGLLRALWLFSRCVGFVCFGSFFCFFFRLWMLGVVCVSFVWFLLVGHKAWFLSVVGFGFGFTFSLWGVLWYMVVVLFCCFVNCWLFP